MLEQSDVAHYLLSLGVVKPRSVMEDGFTVVDASRRNRVFLATTRAGPTFVVKQATAANWVTLAREADVLRSLEGAPELAGGMPELVYEETEGRCLVLRTPGGGRDFSRHEGRFRCIPARSLGRTLASLHRLALDAPPGSGPTWVLDLYAPPHELILDLSAAGQDLVARIQASDYVCGRLEELRAAESSDAFVHGDLRWENCLAIPAPGARRRTRALLVDWELAGRGDPAYDVGSVLAEYLRTWVASVPIIDLADPGRFALHARHPLPSMRPAIAAFWSGYRDGSPSPPPLRRIVELAAARLLETAIEVAQGLAAVTAHVVTLLQLADNLLRAPEVAAESLLGVTE